MPSVDPGWSFVHAGDFNADGNADFVWREIATGRIDIWLMAGPAFLSDTVYAAFPPGWNISATGDADSDGKDDIIWRNTSTGANLLWTMDGSSVTQGTYMPSVDPGWTLAGWGDFNADRRVDLIWRENAPTGRIDVWLMNGATFLSDAVYSGHAQGLWNIASPK